MAKPAKTINIQIDRKPYKVSENPVTGAYLRGLANVSEDYDLWERANGNEDDLLITSEASITLHNGDHFYIAKKVITPGDHGRL